MSSFSRQQLEKFVSEIQVDAVNVIDFGGSQLPVKKRVGKWKVRGNYVIADLSQPHEGEKPDLEIDLNKPMDKQKLGNHLNQYDVAFLFEVSEYLWNPVEAMRNINAFLKSRGTLYLSSHFFYPVHEPMEEDYLRYTPNGIEKILKESGFIIEEHVYRMLEDDNGLYLLAIDEKMRPSRKTSHNFCGSLIKAKKL